MYFRTQRTTFVMNKVVRKPSDGRQTHYSTENPMLQISASSNWFLRQVQGSYRIHIGISTDIMKNVLFFMILEFTRK